MNATSASEKKSKANGTADIAAGVGFLFAGGLSSPAVWWLAKVAARVALAAVGRQLTTIVLDTRAASPPSPSSAPSSANQNNVAVA